MEPIKWHCLSHCGYRSHLTKLVTAIREIIEKDPSELTETDITSFTEWQKQLDRKKEILTDVDAKIIELITEKEELEEEIFETEEIQDMISQSSKTI